MNATARLLDGDEARTAAEAIDRKYPVLERVVVRLYHRVRKLQTVHYELAFDGA